MKQRVGAPVSLVVALAVIVTAAGCGPALSAGNGTVDTKLAADIEVVDATITNLQVAFGDGVPVTQTQVDQLLSDAQRARDGLMSVGSRLAVDDHVRGTSANLTDAVKDLSNSVDSLVDFAALPDTAFATFSTQFRPR